MRRKSGNLNLVAVVFAALLGMFLTLLLFSAARFSFSAFEFSVSLFPAGRGQTIFYIPPIGEVQAQTHLPPCDLHITLLNLDPELLVQTLEELQASGRELLLKEKLRQILTVFMLRCAVLTFLGGAVPILLLKRLRFDRQVLKGGLASMLVFLVLFTAGIALPYDLEAFQNPRYEGVLGAAPWVVNLVGDTVSAVRAVGEQLETIVANMHTLYDQLEQVHPTQQGTEWRVLHVSDIHNNPAAYDFMAKVVRAFDIQLVIDTGDITDYGTPLEAELVKGIADLAVPYVFVPGNHDSPQVVERLKQEGALVLESSQVEAAGLRIAGIADPSAKNQEAAVALADELQDISAAFYDTLVLNKQVDLLAVHNPQMAVPYMGKVPLIVCGHTHRSSVDLSGETAVINAGTTGAAGIRGLQLPDENPYSLVILYFQRDEAGVPALVMADLISVQQRQDTFALQRYYR